MLTNDDLGKIDKLLDRKLDQKLTPLKETLDIHRVSLVKIEHDINVALELRQDVSEVRETAKDHEERISNLESFPKV